MMNCIAFVLCVICAIWQASLGNIGFVVLEAVIALVNLPFAIKWIKKNIRKNKIYKTKDKR